MTEEQKELFSVRLHEVTHAKFHQLQGYAPREILLSSEKKDGRLGFCLITQKTFDIVDNTTDRYKVLDKYSSLSGVFNSRFHNICDNESEIIRIIGSMLEDTEEAIEDLEYDARDLYVTDGLGQSDWNNYVTLACLPSPSNDAELDVFCKKVRDDLTRMLVILETYMSEIYSITHEWCRLDTSMRKANMEPLHYVRYSTLQNYL